MSRMVMIPVLFTAALGCPAIAMAHESIEDARSILPGGAMGAGDTELVGVLGTIGSAPALSTDSQVVYPDFIGQVGNQVPQLETPGAEFKDLEPSILHRIIFVLGSSN